MKKLIKMYNEKYGDTLGVIDDDFNKEQMYRIYYFIKNNCDDEEIQARLEKIKLDKPKTLEQQLTKLEGEHNKVSGGTIDPTIKSDIANIKNDLGDEELTTVNKNVKGAINEVNAQYKEIVKQTITTEERNKLTSLENYDDSSIKNDIQVQKTRIDTFTSLKEGSTTGDAELIDGRIGDNETTYNNIGSAIRNQFKEIKKGVGMKNGGIKPQSLKDYNKTINLFDDTDVLLYKTYNTDSKQFYDSDTDFVSGKIYVNDYIGQKIMIAKFENNVFKSTLICVYFNNNDEQISYAGGVNIVPNNASYMRFATLMNYLGNIMVCLGNSYPSEYVPYAYVNADNFQVKNKFLKDIANDVETNKRVLETLAPAKSRKKKIYCWGDSLTFGAGAMKDNVRVSYPYVLQQLLGDEYEVINKGVGGESGDTIACRQGGLVAYLENDTTFTANTTTDFVAKTIYGIQVKPSRQIGNIDGYINDNSGIIGWNNNTSCSTFTPTKTFTAKAGTPVMMVQNSKDAYLHIICIGQNGVGGVNVNPQNENNYKIWCEVIDAMQSFVNVPVIVLSILDGDEKYNTTVDIYAQKKYGSRYICSRQELCKYGLDIVGLTPTNEDNERISKGSVPKSLFSDDVHLNVNGYTAWANIIYKHIKGLGLF